MEFTGENWILGRRRERETRERHEYFQISSMAN